MDLEGDDFLSSTPHYSFQNLDDGRIHEDYLDEEDDTNASFHEAPPFGDSAHGTHHGPSAGHFSSPHQFQSAHGVPPSPSVAPTTFNRDVILPPHTAVKAVVTGYMLVEPPSGKYVVFVVHVCRTTDNFTWVVFRRYSEFRSLAPELKRVGMSVPALPPKRMIGAFDPAFLESRADGLNQWMRALHAPDHAGRPHAMVPPPVMRAFLSDCPNSLPEGSRPESAQPPSCLPAAVTSAGPAGSGAGAGASGPPGTPSGPGGFASPSHARGGHGAPFASPAVSVPRTPMSASAAPFVPQQRQSSSGASSQSRFSADASPFTPGRFTHLAAGAGADRAGAGAGAAGGAAAAPAAGKRGDDVGLQGFELIRVIGKGSFGKVMLVRRKGHGKLYAMKALNKPHIKKRKQVRHTQTERRVLGYTAHPFIVSMHFAFQTADKLYFVLDYCAGGELFFHLGKHSCFPEPLAAFYTAEMTLALKHLHAKGVVYRDLKPENILLDSDGHIKLADFGLSKEGITDVDGGAHTFCGTAEYLAPEIINRTGHGFAVDWWCLGMVLYEMIVGTPPWYTRDRKQLFKRVRSAPLRFNSKVSPAAQSAITGLLNRDPARRFTHVELMREPLFAGLDWDRLSRKELRPPFKPLIKAGSLDTSNFEPEFTSMAVSHEERPFAPASPTFEGFTFVNQSEHLK